MWLTSQENPMAHSLLFPSNPDAAWFPSEFLAICPSPGSVTPFERAKWEFPLFSLVSVSRCFHHVINSNAKSPLFTKIAKSFPSICMMPSDHRFGDLGASKQKDPCRRHFRGGTMPISAWNERGMPLGGTTFPNAVPHLCWQGRGEQTDRKLVLKGREDILSWVEHTLKYFLAKLRGRHAPQNGPLLVSLLAHWLLLLLFLGLICWQAANTQKKLVRDCAGDTGFVILRCYKRGHSFKGLALCGKRVNAYQVWYRKPPPYKNHKNSVLSCAIIKVYPPRPLATSRFR